MTKRVRFFGFRQMAMVFALAVSSMAYCATTTYYVSNTSGSDTNEGTDPLLPLSNPQTAIDKADGAYPIVVKIMPGTYTMKTGTFATSPSVLNITNSYITIEAYGSGDVIIDGQTLSWTKDNYPGKVANRAITVATGLTDVTIKGLIFRNGTTLKYGRHGEEPYSTAAYACSGLFQDCKFIGKDFDYSSAVLFSGSTVASNCVFTLDTTVNTSYGWGDYALAVYGNCKILDSTIEEFWRFTRADTHPMVIGGSAVVSNCVIRNVKYGRPRNFQTKGYGEAIRSGSIAAVLMSGGSLIGCTLTNLQTYGSMPIVRANASSVVIRDNIFWYNKTTGFQGNIGVKAGVSPTIAGNTAPEFTLGENGNTSFEPWQEFCTSNSVAVGKAPFAVEFRNKGNVSATWDFGDGSETVTAVKPTHTYTKVGAYTVKMTVEGVTYERENYIVATGPKMYVSKTGSAEKPYDTLAKAANHPQDAIDLAPEGAGTEIEIDDGTYTAREPAKDDSILEIQKSGLTIKARNGAGHVWIDSQAATGNGVSRSNIIVGKGFEDILVDSLIFTNGMVQTECGPTCAQLGSGVFTNCVFNLRYIHETGGVKCGGTAKLTHCRVCSEGIQKTTKFMWIVIGYDNALSLTDSATLEYSVVSGNYLKTTTGVGCSVISINSASATIRNCLIVGNESGTTTSTVGLGALYASAGTIENCTIVGNEVSGGKGGGVYLASDSVVFRNNIVWGNTAPNDSDGYNVYPVGGMAGCTYSASPDLDATKENLNVKLTRDDDPGFTDYAGGDYTPILKSLMTGAGSVQDWMAGAVDLKGLPRLYDGTVSMGAYEPQGRSVELLGDFSVSGSDFGRLPYTATFSATVTGGSGNYLYKWDFGDGTVTDFITDANPTHTYTSVKGYNVKLIVSDGTIVTEFPTKTNLVVAVGETCYLRPDQEGEPPYDTWAKATSNIEAAVALQPNTVLATNGTYYTFNIKDKYGLNLNRAITVKSVEGPTKTMISRAKNVYSGSYVEFHNATLSHEGAVLDGFTLSGSIPPAIEASAGLIKNCIVTNAGKAFLLGVIGMSGTAVMSNCVVDAKGADSSDTCNELAIARVCGNAQLLNCEFRNLSKTAPNQNEKNRGGVVIWGNAIMRNCYVHDVSLALSGFWDTPPSAGLAGIYAMGNAVVDNCTVTRCWSKFNPGGGINATSGATVRNCIAYGNTGNATKDPFDIRTNLTVSVFQNNLIGAGKLPDVAEGCLIGVDPCFETNGPAYRITRASPCFNAGLKLPWCKRRGMAKDFEGNERKCGQPDIGCYEIPHNVGMMLILR